MTNKMGQLNICTPQMKITPFLNAASHQQVPAPKVYDYDLANNHFQTDDKEENGLLSQPVRDLGVGAFGAGHLTADQTAARQFPSLDKAP